MNIIDKAKLIAYVAHSATGQRRKYTDLNYFIHPDAVAKLVAIRRPYDNHIIAAAYLHDVVEDTGLTQEFILNEFNEDIADMVKALTKDSLAKGNRHTRVKLQEKRLEHASMRVKTIKIADLIDNMPSIILYDPEFAKTYISESANLLPLLKEGDAKLYLTAQTIIDNYYKENNDETASI